MHSMAAPRSRWSNMRSDSSLQHRAQPLFGSMSPVEVVPFDESTIKSNQWLFVTKHVVKVIGINSLGEAGRRTRGNRDRLLTTTRFGRCGPSLLLLQQKSFTYIAVRNNIAQLDGRKPQATNPASSELRHNSSQPGVRCSRHASFGICINLFHTL